MIIKSTKMDCNGILKKDTVLLTLAGNCQPVFN